MGPHGGGGQAAPEQVRESVTPMPTRAARLQLGHRQQAETSAAPPSTTRGKKDLEVCSPGKTRASEMTSLLPYSASPETPGTRSSVFRSQLVLPPTYHGAQAAAEQKALGEPAGTGTLCTEKDCPGQRPGTRWGTNADLPPAPPAGPRKSTPVALWRGCCPSARGLGPLLRTSEGHQLPPCQRPLADPQAVPAVSHGTARGGENLLRTPRHDGATTGSGITRVIGDRAHPSRLAFLTAVCPRP